MYAEIALGALVLIRQLQAEKRPPTAEEVEKLDADIAAERERLHDNLDRLEREGDQ